MVQDKKVQNEHITINRCGPSTTCTAPQAMTLSDLQSSPPRCRHSWRAICLN